MIPPVPPGIRRVDPDAEAARLAGERNHLPEVVNQPSLSPEEIRLLLRECVTVVKPGEILVLRAYEWMTPAQVREVDEGARDWLKDNAPAVRAIILPFEGLGVIEGGFDERVAEAINTLGPVVGVDGKVRANYRPAGDD